MCFYDIIFVVQFGSFLKRKSSFSVKTQVTFVIPSLSLRVPSTSPWGSQSPTEDSFMKYIQPTLAQPGASLQTPLSFIDQFIHSLILAATPKRLKMVLPVVNQTILSFCQRWTEFIFGRKLKNLFFAIQLVWKGHTIFFVNRQVLD